MKTDLEWKLYCNDRVVAFVPSGFCVIKPVEAADGLPLYCPVCDFMLATIDDRFAFERFSCCAWCANTWAYSRAEEWSFGWRPSDDEIKDAIDSKHRAVISM